MAKDGERKVGRMGCRGVGEMGKCGEGVGREREKERKMMESVITAFSRYLKSRFFFLSSFLQSGMKPTINVGNLSTSTVTCPHQS